MHGEEEGGPTATGGESRGDAGAREEQGRRDVPRTLTTWKGIGSLPRIHHWQRVGGQQNRPVGGAGAPRASEVLRRENLREPRRRPNSWIVPDDRLVVVGEIARQTVGITERARRREKEGGVRLGRLTGAAPSVPSPI